MHDIVGRVFGPTHVLIMITYSYLIYLGKIQYFVKSTENNILIFAS